MTSSSSVRPLTTLLILYALIAYRCNTAVASRLHRMSVTPLTRSLTATTANVATTAATATTAADDDVHTLGARSDAVLH
jgi:hypothetical protein